MHVHIHLHIIHMQMNIPYMGQGRADGGGRAGAHIRYMYLYDMYNMHMYLYMHMYVYLYMSPSSFLIATSAKESILGTCSRKNEHGNLGIKDKTSTFPRDGGDGGDGGGGDGFPRTLDIWRSPVPTCPGTKYPVRGIPHFV